VMFGAGSAGLGIADLICTAMHENDGITKEEARTRVWLVDSRGLVIKDRTSGGISDTKAPYAHELAAEHLGGEPTIKDLGEIVKVLKATCIIGVSGQPKVFTESVCTNMAANTEKPIIFPMSNPTHKAECSFADAYKWTKGKVIFASGSPFPTITDGDKVVKPAQGNNAYIFPGVALGVIATKCINIPDSFFITAAKALADMVSPEMIEAGTLFPPLQDIQKCSKIIACAVGESAYKMGLATAMQPKNMMDLIESCMFDHKTVPVYSHEGYEGLTKQYTGRTSVVYTGNAIPGM
jgi:malate dehydrogenase (oxaloacetate-decarboxylating)(NADP+)